MRTNKNHKEQGPHKELAHLLILSQQGVSAPIGPEPTLEELSLLMENRLDPVRKRAVYSHLNSNPELMAQWLECVASLEEMGESNSFKHWMEKQWAKIAVLFDFTPRQLVWGGSVSMALLAVVMITQNTSTLTGIEPVPTDSVGVFSATGDQVENELERLNEISEDLYQECVTSHLDEANIAHYQQEIIRYLGTLESILAADHPIFVTLNSKSTLTSTEFCEANTELMAALYKYTQPEVTP